MIESRRNALVAALAWRLREHGSWSGETHLQKATYLLQHLAGVPLHYVFILYKHGPFSFQLRDALAAMRAHGILKLEMQPYPYGPSFVVPPDQKEGIEKHYPRALKKYGDKLDFVADWVGAFKASDLEQVTTALYASLECGTDASAAARINRVRALKPHVSNTAAAWAVAEIDKQRSVLKSN